MAPLAITYPGVVAVPEDAGEGPRREILIDATNPMGLDPDAGLCPHSHAVLQGAHTAALLPRAPRCRSIYPRSWRSCRTTGA